MRALNCCICLLSLGLASMSVTALEKRTEHTWKLAEGEQPAASSIEDAAMLAGNWRGTAFGQNFEETWSSPSAGSMVGFFKLMKDDQPVMYEIMLLSMVDGRLSLKVKHFNPDFTAWEEKADFVNFKFLGKDDNAIHFSGISFYKRGENHLDGYLVMKHGDEIREEHLVYERMTSP